MKKIKLIFITIFGFTFSVAFLQAQHLFTVNYNELSPEKISQLKANVSKSNISALSLTKNNENKDVYQVALSSVENTKIVILNEETGNNVVLVPTEESQPQFMLQPFFIEELKHSVLGDASDYLVVETSSDYAVRNVASVSASHGKVFSPQYLYGTKEDVKEALPKDRKILHIFKEKPQYITIESEDPEFHSYIAQLEEDMSYYVYMFQLPNGALWIYDEHFNIEDDNSGTRIGEQLDFILSGTLNETQKTPTLFALDLWSQKLHGSVPIDIIIDSESLSQGVIGASYRMPMYNPDSTWYCSALGNQLTGINNVTNMRDIKLLMSSDFNFYYGTTGNPSYSQIDWATVMLHEVAHGLGFFAIVGQSGAYAYTTNSGGTASTPYPSIFDRQLFQGVLGPCITELTQSARAAVIISNNGLYSGAPDSHLLAATGGTRVQMYAPTTYASGSSVSHWGNSVSQTFMNYAISNGSQWRLVSDRKLGIMLDLGWTPPVFYPNSIWVTFDANTGEGIMSKQQFIPEEEQQLKANIYKKTGHTYTGWNTQADGTGTPYTDKQYITITEDDTLYAQWEVNTYTLTFNPGTGATVEPASKTVTYDAPIGEMPIPVRPGYQFVEWRYGATPITETTIWNFEISISVSASWVVVNHIITATAAEGGTISPSGDITVSEGNNQLFTITPDENYEISAVFVDQDSVGKETEYKFTNVTASHTIHAEFCEIVGIKEKQNSSAIIIIPNPASHTVELRMENGEWRMENVEFFDIYGRKVATKFPSNSLEGWQPQADGVVFNISHLSAGIYFVKISTDQGEVVQKMIKQ